MPMWMLFLNFRRWRCPCHWRNFIELWIEELYHPNGRSAGAWYAQRKWGVAVKSWVLLEVRVDIRGKVGIAGGGGSG